MKENETTQSRTTVRDELHRQIEKMRTTPIKRPEDQSRASKVFHLEESPDESKSPDDFETESTSNNLTDVPAINFKRYLGATGVPYVQMGQASHIQADKSWDLEETVRQAEHKFTADLKLIAAETTDDENLLKTLV